MCIFGDSSQLELKQITQSSDTLLMDDLAELRKYHLVSAGGETPNGGARLVVPDWIRLMKDLIKSKVRNPSRLEQGCNKARQESPDVEGEVGRWINRVVALWRDESVEDALVVAQQAKTKFPSNSDLRCLLGRAYLKVSPPQARRAEAAFRKAYELKCQRVELLNLWVETKRMLGDWIGILEIMSMPTYDILGEEAVLVRAEAHTNLGDLSARAGDYAMAVRHFLSGIDDMEDALERNPAIGRMRELLTTRSVLYQSYILMLDKIVTDPSDFHAVWHAIARAYKRSSVPESTLKLGIERLNDWWLAVEGRKAANRASLEMLNNQIDIINNFIGSLIRRDWHDKDFIEHLQQTSTRLNQKSVDYARRIQ